MIGSHNDATHPADGQANESFLNFVMQLEDSPTTIPDFVVASYLQSAGFEANDPRLVRLMSLAGQKFIAEILNDALQQYRAKHTSAPNKKQNKEKKPVLTMEDLSQSLSDHGINCVKTPYSF